QLLSEQFSPTNLYDGIFSVSAGEGAAGNVTLETQQIQIMNGATILTPTLGIGSGGNINLLASKSVDITNGSIVVTGTISPGDSGDINIITPQLRVLQDGYIITSPGLSGEGQGGNITVNADTVELRGVKSGVASPGGLFTATLGTGGAGDITINTQELSVAEGAQVSASAAGAGKGGNLTVNAESVQLRGVSQDGRFLSGLLTSSSLLTVQGQKGTAPAGDLTVNTQRLVVRDGAQISAATGGEGAAGNLTLNASESIDVVGFATNIDESVEAVSFGTIGDGIVPSSIESNTSGAGSAGDLRINTGRLTVRNDGEIGVRGTNAGAAGNLEIQADRVLLDNDGTISAATVAGTGGNIRLQAQRVELRRGSQITTNASNADGGNITLGTSNLVALENSDITANAQAGKGGQVIINAQGVFGTQFREFQTPNSDITATSELGAEFSGAVEISSPEVDPSA
ncbi:MAG: filamentous hemagglutinin N-terminal domain-containing protein, partial [Planktothrix sp.]